MRQRALLMLALAFVLAIAAVFMARGWLQQQVPGPVIIKQEQQQKAPIHTIVVARSRLEFGHKMRAEHIYEIPWATDKLPEGAFEKKADLFKKENFRIVLRSIEPNEPVLASRISGEGGRGTLSAIISDDMRAFTIRVNDVNGVAGFVLPGDRVDVLVTREERKDRPITDVLLQNVKVLGVDQQADEKTDKPKVARAATLEVTPRQAQKLTLAQRVGILSLALRGVVDAQEAKTHTVRVLDLKVGEVQKPAAQPKPVAKRATRVKWKPVEKKPVIDPFANVKVVRGLSPQQYRVTKEDEKKTDKPVAAVPGAAKPDQPSKGDANPPAATGQPVPLTPDLMSRDDSRKGAPAI